MNIFVLDKDPRIAAQMHCDKHVPKMILESAQMLCTALNTLGISTPYKTAHINHPCSIWVRMNQANFNFLCDLGDELGEEFIFRYGHAHRSHGVVNACRSLGVNKFPPSEFVTQPYLAMPDEYKVPGKIVKSYQNYYRSKTFAKWERGRPSPEWW